MVVPTQNSIVVREKIRALELPIIDLKSERSEVSKLLVKACEDFGFFKVINHGVPENVIAEMEIQSQKFFAMGSSEKERVGPANPCGYGCKNIGFNGDVGNVEYLILNANPLALSQQVFPTSSTFSTAASSYVKAVRKLACEILDMVAEGLWVPDTSVFSKMIRDVDCDSLLRINHYPTPVTHCSTTPLPLSRHLDTSDASTTTITTNNNNNRIIGFGEHTDPQILTVLRSNGVDGLQISVDEGVWVPITSHPTAFFVNVGDVLQAMTNGRFLSVRHRAVVNMHQARMSMAYFGAPPPRAKINPIPELVNSQNPRLYRSFTWADYKKATYSRRLGDSRLHLFKLHSDN